MADVSQYLPRLPFNALAQFEIASGLMVLNVDLTTFQQSAANYAGAAATPEDIDLYSTINHETYHYFQTIATGYQYSCALETWQAIVDEASSQLRQEGSRRQRDQEEEKRLQSELDKVAGASAPAVKRFVAFQTLVDEAQRAHSWEDSAGHDWSLLSAQLPSLARRFDDLWARIRATGVEGLSAEALIEGSAIIFQQLLTYANDGDGDRKERLEERLTSAWEAAGDGYRKSYDVAQQICGARALEIILPATALALRYTNPPAAYLEFLKMLEACEPGNEISAARALASVPPGMEAAGEHLGTALDVRRKDRARNDQDHYPVYDEVLDKLEQRAWGFDEIELLSDFRFARKVDAFPFITVVKDGVIRTDLDSALLAKRLVCGRLVLRTAKLPRYRREAEKRLMDRIHPIIASLFDPMMSANEYNQLGLDYLSQGDLDQAESMLKMALSIYYREDQGKGIARQLYNLGLVWAARNNREMAQEMYLLSLSISEKIRDEELIAMAGANLGDEYMRVGRLEEAEALMRRALEIEARLGQKAGMAVDCFNLGRIYYARKDFEQARAFLIRAVDLYRAVGNTSMVERIEKGLADMDKVPRQETPS